MASYRWIKRLNALCWQRRQSVLALFQIDLFSLLGGSLCFLPNCCSVDCRVEATRSTKRRQIPSEVTSAVEDGASGNRVKEEQEFAEDNRNVLKPQDNECEVDRMSLAYSVCETEREQQKESGSLLSHQGPPPLGDYVLWRVDSSQDEDSVKNIQILASIRSNYGSLDDIASPFEDPEILALLPKSSGSTSYDASMDECILSSDGHCRICPHSSDSSVDLYMFSKYYPLL
ncbi:hypothetical protein M9434_001288 [Picochlorum sp. BPE23]|nr:hypothetical protein M9434_001288 [Picochlorum sp. BPE23]